MRYLLYQIKRKKLLVPLIFFLFCLVIICGLLFMPNTYDNKSMTKEEITEDYNYFWTSIEESWPFINIAKENGVDIDKLKKTTLKTILKNPTDRNFYNTMYDLTYKISTNKEGLLIGHLYPFNYYTYFYFSQYRYPGLFGRIVHDKEIGNKYRYINSILKVQFDSSSDSTMYDSLGNKVRAQQMFDKNVSLEIIEEGKIAKIRFNSFNVYAGDRVLYYTYINNLNKIYSQLSNYEHVIFDVTGNGGGIINVPDELIVGPNIDKVLTYKLRGYTRSSELNKQSYGEITINRMYDTNELSITNDDLVNLDKYEDFNMTAYVISHGKDKSLSDVKKWVLVDEHSYSTTCNFAYFCMKTGFATVVGNKTGGGPCPIGMSAFSLPNSKFVVAYEGVYCVDDNGNCLIEGFDPDIVSKQDETPLETCLKEIEKYNKNN